MRSGVPVLLPELERDLQCDLDRSGAVVAVERPRKPLGRHLDELLGQACRRLMRRGGEGAMHQGLGLPPDRLAHPRMPMPEVVAPPRPTRIEHPPPLRPNQPRPLGALDDEQRLALMILTRGVGSPNIPAIKRDELFGRHGEGAWGEVGLLQMQGVQDVSGGEEGYADSRLVGRTVSNALRPPLRTPPPTPTRSPPSAPEPCSDLAAPLAPGFAFGSLVACGLPLLAR